MSAQRSSKQPRARYDLARRLIPTRGHSQISLPKVNDIDHNLPQEVTRIQPLRPASQTKHITHAARPMPAAPPQPAESRANHPKPRFPRMHNPIHDQDLDFLDVPEFHLKPAGWKPSPPHPGSDEALETRAELLARIEHNRKMKKHAKRHPRKPLKEWREVSVWAAPRTRPDIPLLRLTTPQGRVMGLRDENSYD